MRRRTIRIATCCLASTFVISGYGMMASAKDADSKLPVAGITFTMSKDYTPPQAVAAPVQTEAAQQLPSTAEVAPVSEYANVAIAQVSDFVNIRNTPGEEGEILGKLYNNCAATVEAEENGWYKITSGSVTGYVKSEFVVRDNPELAREVGRRVAYVNTETLRVREEANAESSIIELVPEKEALTVIEEPEGGWVKVAVEAGEGYVSKEFVECKTIFSQAESKEEEEARLAKEEAERKEAARKAEEARRAEAARVAAQQRQSNAAVSMSDTFQQAAPAITYSAPSGDGNGDAVANFACQFVGNPYVYGGTSLTNGADCSGFVMSVYANFGISLPRTSDSQRSAGYEVSYDQAQPGDIICYSGHVGIYIGGGQLVHASTPATGIKISSATHAPILNVRRIF